MAFASSGAFMLPFLIYQGWIEYMAIPAKDYPVWQLPATEPGTVFLLSAVTTMQVQLHICRKANDGYYNTFPLTASGKVRLGKVFERFIIDQQQQQGLSSVIEIQNKQQRAFGWQFYEEKWFGLYSRNLNPARSLVENNIKPNAKIVVVRINE